MEAVGVEVGMVPVSVRNRLFAGRSSDLERRMAELEDAVQECRALNVRLAELTDVVAELLLPVAARDEARIEELLKKYRRDFS
ncbi:hypothetical protein EXE58_13360 [Nocardioides seonyuensis]|uniref:DUF6752 domain-containing protein n=1 Tax=Nocardioides seonyuensis TaxID=2518371 RepID=A0A4P7IGE4_9ACTN|nr:hypothetical protein EXE58_13360 [Nocardioides seonyuensis]